MTPEQFLKAVPIYDNLKIVENTINELQLIEQRLNATDKTKIEKFEKIIIQVGPGYLVEIGNLTPFFSKDLLRMIYLAKYDQKKGFESRLEKL